MSPPYSLSWCGKPPSLGDCSKLFSFKNNLKMKKEDERKRRKERERGEREKEEREREGEGEYKLLARGSLLGS